NPYTSLKGKSIKVLILSHLYKKFIPHLSALNATILPPPVFLEQKKLFNSPRAYSRNLLA
ncbi:MAG: hypothetical protein WCN27_03380, partial [Alphaproteobacteria bacterium]